MIITVTMNPAIDKTIEKEEVLDAVETVGTKPPKKERVEELYKRIKS